MRRKLLMMLLMLHGKLIVDNTIQARRVLIDSILDLRELRAYLHLFGLQALQKLVRGLLKLLLLNMLLLMLNNILT